MFTTETEIGFINGLGTWRDRVCTGEMLVKLLEGYLEGIGHRVFWGRINKDRVMRHAHARLEAARQALKPNVPQAS